MSGEGKFTAVDVVEMVHAMAGVASAAWTFFSKLKEEGFDDAQAFELTRTWIGSIGGSRS